MTFLTEQVIDSKIALHEAKKVLEATGKSVEARREWNKRHDQKCKYERLYEYAVKQMAEVRYEMERQMNVSQNNDVSHNPWLPSNRIASDDNAYSDPTVHYVDPTAHNPHDNEISQWSSSEPWWFDFGDDGFIDDSLFPESKNPYPPPKFSDN